MLEEIAARIKELRKQKNMKQKELGNKLNLKQPHISLLESGKHYMSLKTLEKIANALGKKVKIKFV